MYEQDFIVTILVYYNTIVMDIDLYHDIFWLITQLVDYPTLCALTKVPEFRQYALYRLQHGFKKVAKTIPATELMDCACGIFI